MYIPNVYRIANMYAYTLDLLLYRISHMKNKSRTHLNMFCYRSLFYFRVYLQSKQYIKRDKICNGIEICNKMHSWCRRTLIKWFSRPKFLDFLPFSFRLACKLILLVKVCLLCIALFRFQYFVIFNFKLNFSNSSYSIPFSPHFPWCVYIQCSHCAMCNVHTHFWMYFNIFEIIISIEFDSENCTQPLYSQQKMP